MRCAKCGAANPEGLKFCEQCAAPLNQRCANCGFENSPAARFCGQCAAPLNSSPDAASSPRSVGRTSGPASISEITTVHPVAALEGERKNVTALFSDIKGSTELEQNLDPEEARAIIDPALKLMIEAVHRYDGYVVQSTGDGIFAIFGAPVAHEDHPQRALHAALRMQEELRRYSAELVADGGNPLQCRVGVNTGEVVVRSITTGSAKTEYTPIGHTTNLASRMQAVAPVGSIAVAEPTRKLCEGYFALKSLGPTRVKGISEPIDVYEVTGLGPIRTRLQRSAGRGYTKFVGRRREIETMEHAAELAKGGHGQIVAVVAEPGVGKSRLFFEFKARNQLGFTLLEAVSVSHGKASAYIPVIDLLHRYFEIAGEDDARRRRQRVLGKVLDLDHSLEDAIPYLFELLGIIEGDGPLAQMDVQIRRRRTQEAVKRILLRESFNQPLLLIFEDLHWIDEETQAFLKIFAEGLANAPVLLLVNYRPEYSHSWGSKTYYTQLRLDPLPQEGADEMLSALVGDTPNLAPLKRLVLERAQGNPLFMEELVEALFEEGVLVRNGAVSLTRPLSQLKIPPTVQGILAGRIDRLPPDEKGLLQTLAVIGTGFPLTLVRRVVNLPNEQIDSMLSDLQTREFIYEQPAAGYLEYQFKHALTHQAAYDALLAERRKLLHGSIARAIESLHADRLEDHYRELARHYLLSNDAAKATRYSQLAARQALDRAAYAEADGLIDAALHRLEKLPEGEERLRAELTLREIESVVAFVLYGAAGPKRERAIIGCCEIAERLGEQSRLLRGLVNLSSLHWVRGEYVLGIEVALRCLGLRDLAPDPGWLADIYWQAAVLSEGSGKLLGAVALYESAGEAARDAARLKRPLSPTWGILHTIMTANNFCSALQLLGRSDQARKVAEEAFSKARTSQHLFTLSHTLVQAGLWLSLLRLEYTKILAYAQEVVVLAEQNGFAEWPGHGELFRGVALVNLGDVEEGVAAMERGLELLKSVGTVWPLLGAQLAWGYARSGRTDQALKTLEQVLAEADRLGAFNEKAEMLRINGEILLMGDHPVQVEAEICLRHSIEIAREQEAKWWELRSTVSLARLLSRTGRREEARGKLAEIYNWFTEGFDTADLKEAKMLIDELSEQA